MRILVTAALICASLAAAQTAPGLDVDPAGKPWRVAGAPCDEPAACSAACAAGDPRACAWASSGVRRFADVQACDAGDAATCGRFRAAQGSPVAPWATQKLQALCGQRDVEACRLLFAGANALPPDQHLRAAHDAASKVITTCAADPRGCLAFGHACGRVPTCDALCARGLDGACVESLAIADVPSRAAVDAARGKCPADVGACVLLVRWSIDLKGSDKALSAEAARAGWSGLEAACGATRRDGCSGVLDAWATWNARPADALLKKSVSTLVAACSAGEHTACVDVAASRRHVGSAAQQDEVGAKLWPRCEGGDDGACEALLFVGGLVDGGPPKPFPAARARAGRALDAVVARCAGGAEAACLVGERTESSALAVNQTQALDAALCARGRVERCRTEAPAARCAAGDLAVCESLVAVDRPSALQGFLAKCHDADGGACARAAALYEQAGGVEPGLRLRRRACRVGIFDLCGPAPTTTRPATTTAPPRPTTPAPTTPAATTPAPTTPAPTTTAPAAPTKTPGGQWARGAVVEVLWKGDWYRAQILDFKDGAYHVHYVGYAALYDEWVAPDRVRAQR